MLRDISTADLLARLAAAEMPKQLRFSVCRGDGWITSPSREVVDMLVEVWNRRTELSALAHKGTSK